MSDIKNQPFFMVFMDGGNAPTIKHQTLDSAEKESKRLSELTGKKAYILCSIKSIECAKFVITDMRPGIDELPF